MPDPLLFTPDTAQRFFDAAAEEAISPGELLSAPELGLGWNPRLAPILTLLQQLLLDVFRVRDLVVGAHARGRKPPRGLRGQYERDLQWVRAPAARVPFSFGWVCLALGLEPSAVRRRYLGGQPAGRVRRSVQGDRPVLSPPAAKRPPAAPGPV